MLRRVLCVVVGFLLPVLPAFGQGGVAEVNGSVTDQTGSVLPGVTITLTEETTGLQRTVVIERERPVRYPGIDSPGGTRSGLSWPAFKRKRAQAVAVLVGQAVTIQPVIASGGTDGRRHRDRRGAAHRGHDDRAREERVGDGDREPADAGARAVRAAAAGARSDARR